MSRTLALAPRLDLSAAQQLQSDLSSLMNEDAILDAANVDHLGALAAQLLLAASKAYSDAGHELKIVNMSERVSEQLDVMGLSVSKIEEFTG